MSIPVNWLVSVIASPAMNLRLPLNNFLKINETQEKKV